LGDGKTLAHGYRSLQHWNQWLSQQFLGNCLLAEEARIIAKLLDRHYGKHSLLIGVPKQARLLNISSIPCRAIATPLFVHREQHINYIETTLHELPVITGSIDLVLLPHTLEFIENPRQLLSEACRVVKPEGLIAICGFNPYSLWGLRKFFSDKEIPWSGHFFQPGQVRNWLKLADFEMEMQTSILFRPPLSHSHWYERLAVMEHAGKFLFNHLGGVYVLLARAKVIPLTPIKMKWTQQLSGIRIPSSVSGPIAHHSNQ
jgi:SAM-dependent methyltransferase